MINTTTTIIIITNMFMILLILLIVNLTIIFVIVKYIHINHKCWLKLDFSSLYIIIQYNGTRIIIRKLVLDFVFIVKLIQGY